MIRVLIADDHTIVRRGLRQILADEQDMRADGEAPNAQELMVCLRDSDWGVLVLDLNMPGKSGLEVLEDVKLRWPKLPVLILSMHPEDPYAVRALKAGASGYLTKQSAPDQLVAAIRKVHSGGRYVSPATAELLARELAGGAASPHEALSNREYQVLCELAVGKTVSEVAARLKLSVKTISTYRTRLLDKLGLANNAELMHYAIQRQLVD
jgi:two-component system, NarL family, invasion response regulator UvrY